MTLDELLIRHPRLFRGKSRPLSNLAPDHPWLNRVLDQLLTVIENEFDDDLLAQVTFHDLSTKYGALVIDETAPAPISRLCRLAEDDSARTCEKCGADNARCREGAWLATLCERCANASV